MLASERVHILGQAMRMFDVAKEETDVVKKLSTGQEPLIFCDSVQACHNLIHAPILTCNITVPHADTGFRGNDLETGIHPETHAPSDFQCLCIAPNLVAVEEACQDLVQGVVRGPDLAVSTSVRGPLFEHDELVRRISTDEALAPVPVVCSNTFLAQIRVMGLLAWAGRHFRGISGKRSPVLNRSA